MQSSSHMAPSGLACPLTEQDFLVTGTRERTRPLKLVHLLLSLRGLFLELRNVLLIYRYCHINMWDRRNMSVCHLLAPSWQYGPVRSGGQRQRYPLISSTQVDPKAHGDDWHSLMSVRGGERRLRKISLPPSRPRCPPPSQNKRAEPDRKQTLG